MNQNQLNGMILDLIKDILEYLPETETPIRLREELNNIRKMAENNKLVEI